MVAGSRQQALDMSSRTSPAVPDRNPTGGSAVQGLPVHGSTPVVDVVVAGASVVDVGAVELVELLELVVVVWAPAVVAANNPRHPASNNTVRLGTVTSRSARFPDARAPGGTVLGYRVAPK